MVWKKIMNRRKKTKNNTENHLIGELMEQYLGELALDLNLKLLCERQALDCGDTKADMMNGNELFYAERMLWVDNIIVTAYETAPDEGQADRDSHSAESPHSVQSTHEPWYRRLRKFFQSC